MPNDQENLDLFRVYLDQVGQHPLLTAEDEVRLAKAIEAGDEWARRKMIESNLRLVVSIMGFSRERARQVERDALAALRSPEICARLQGFSGAA